MHLQPLEASKREDEATRLQQAHKFDAYAYAYFLFELVPYVRLLFYKIGGVYHRNQSAVNSDDCKKIYSKPT